MCITSSRKDAERVTKICYELNFEGITFPVNINDIPKFEKKNKTCC